VLRVDPGVRHPPGIPRRQCGDRTARSGAAKRRGFPSCSDGLCGLHRGHGIDPSCGTELPPHDMYGCTAFGMCCLRSSSVCEVAYTQDSLTNRPLRSSSLAVRIMLTLRHASTVSKCLYFRASGLGWSRLSNGHSWCDFLDLLAISTGTSSRTLATYVIGSRQLCIL